jgi:hypothetical protein
MCTLGEEHQALRQTVRELAEAKKGTNQIQRVEMARQLLTGNG